MSDNSRNNTSNQVNDSRKSSIHRRLTQQNMDQGDEREFAIKHAQVTLELNGQTYNDNHKEVKQIVKERLSEMVKDFRDSEKDKLLKSYDEDNSHFERKMVTNGYRTIKNIKAKS